MRRKIQIVKYASFSKNIDDLIPISILKSNIDCGFAGKALDWCEYYAFENLKNIVNEHMRANIEKIVWDESFANDMLASGWDTIKIEFGSKNYLFRIQCQ